MAVLLLAFNLYESYIVFVWSQNDGSNIEQRTIAFGCRQNDTDMIFEMQL